MSVNNVRAFLIYPVSLTGLIVNIGLKRGSRTKQIIIMNVTCPFCGSEDAYYNGVKYECPECDRTWDDEDEDEDEF